MRIEVRSDFERRMCQPEVTTIEYCRFYKQKIQSTSRDREEFVCPETCYYAQLRNQESKDDRSL